MKRKIPLLICLVSGLLFIIQFFVPHILSQRIYENGLRWFIVIYTFTLLMAVGSLINHNLRKLLKKDKDWQYCIITLFSLFGMIIAGFVTGISRESFFMKLYTNVQVPMQSTMFGILAFYIASASYRAFRARSKEATLLLLSGFILMLSAVSLVNYLFPSITEISEWLLMVPSLAANRGILFGAYLGTLATALKIILGIERGWMGGNK